MVKKVLSLLLIACLVLGMLPTTAAAAETSLTLSSSITDNPELWAQFKAAFSSAQQGDEVTVTVSGSITLHEPLENYNGATFHIQGTGGATITANPAFKENFEGIHMLRFWGGNASSKVTIQNLTLDGGKHTGVLEICDYGTVLIGGDSSQQAVTIQNCNTGLENGGGLRLREVTLSTIQNCRFTGNKGSSSAPISGALYYSMNTEHAPIDGVSPGLRVVHTTFENNEAHSGGGMKTRGRFFCLDTFLNM